LKKEIETGAHPPFLRDKGVRGHFTERTCGGDLGNRGKKNAERHPKKNAQAIPGGIAKQKKKREGNEKGRADLNLSEGEKGKKLRGRAKASRILKEQISKRAQLHLDDEKGLRKRGGEVQMG